MRPGLAPPVRVTCSPESSAACLRAASVPLEATAWGVWLHGEAGRAASAAIGPIGFLARDLPAYIPGLMADR